jgi:acid phosphatase
MNRLSGMAAAGAALSLVAGSLLAGTAAAERPDRRDHGSHPPGAGRHDGRLPGGYQRLVVIYEENHSFDNLYGSWGSVHGRRVDGIRNAERSATRQVAQDGTPYSCKLQNDVNLTSPPQSVRCSDSHRVNTDTATSPGFTSHFRNGPFSIDDYIRPADTTCPAPGAFSPAGVPKGTGEPGGCTRDLVHRFYQEQYQLNDGAQNRYVTGSDAVGLTMDTYDTRSLPVYRYLHSRHAPKYVVADRFFQAAFGGSFLNHQWLIAARTPLDTNHGTLAKNSVVDRNGMPTKYPLYTPTGPVEDNPLTRSCRRSPDVDRYARACGDYAVNTVQPAVPPTKGETTIPLIDDAKYPNIGDRMTQAGISWNWYAGGWDAVNKDPATAPLFQYHHQPFNYFANYAPGQPGRTHLRDEKEFRTAAQQGSLPTVSFVKPYGMENEHPGYASEPNGSDHLVDLIRDVVEGPQGRSTLVVVTYDEFGGQWDHVAPPGQGGTRGVHDAWGPGTRIPALVIARSMRHSGVDHTPYDTTSILATIERSFGLEPLSSRDESVNDLSPAVAAGGRHRH